eukprot:TRINITY_DN6675_c0_g1_i1.p1 TRINITY_DN6675_c0_g1~~TRINITY_DN6675_c0_g1_i1.p1  ORF type:complete len:1174 (+),score=295.12 TRINITY_DN6675_c0_g1_i1:50-3571(+)
MPALRGSAGTPSGGRRQMFHVRSGCVAELLREFPEQSAEAVCDHLMMVGYKMLCSACRDKQRVTLKDVERLVYRVSKALRATRSGDVPNIEAVAASARRRRAPAEPPAAAQRPSVRPPWRQDGHAGPMRREDTRASAAAPAAAPAPRPPRREPLAWRINFSEPFARRRSSSAPMRAPSVDAARSPLGRASPSDPPLSPPSAAAAVGHRVRVRDSAQQRWQDGVVVGVVGGVPWVVAEEEESARPWRHVHVQAAAPSPIPAPARAASPVPARQADAAAPPPHAPAAVEPAAAAPAPQLLQPQQLQPQLLQPQSRLVSPAQLSAQQLSAQQLSAQQLSAQQVQQLSAQQLSAQVRQHSAAPNPLSRGAVLRSPSSSASGRRRDERSRRPSGHVADAAPPPAPGPGPGPPAAPAAQGTPTRQRGRADFAAPRRTLSPPSPPQPPPQPQQVRTLSPLQRAPPASPPQRAPPASPPQRAPPASPPQRTPPASPPLRVQRNPLPTPPARSPQQAPDDASAASAMSPRSPSADGSTRRALSPLLSSPSVRRAPRAGSAGRPASRSRSRRARSVVQRPPPACRSDSAAASLPRSPGRGDTRVAASIPATPPRAASPAAVPSAAHLAAYLPPQCRTTSPPPPRRTDSPPRLPAVARMSPPAPQQPRQDPDGWEQIVLRAKAARCAFAGGVWARAQHSAVLAGTGLYSRHVSPPVSPLPPAPEASAPRSRQGSAELTPIPAPPAPPAPPALQAPQAPAALPAPPAPPVRTSPRFLDTGAADAGGHPALPPSDAETPPEPPPTMLPPHRSLEQELECSSSSHAPQSVSALPLPASPVQLPPPAPAQPPPVSLVQPALLPPPAPPPHAVAALPAAPPPARVLRRSESSGRDPSPPPALVPEPPGCAAVGVPPLGAAVCVKDTGEWHRGIVVGRRDSDAFVLTEAMAAEAARPKVWARLQLVEGPRPPLRMPPPDGTVGCIWITLLTADLKLVARTPGATPDSISIRCGGSTQAVHCDCGTANVFMQQPLGFPLRSGAALATFSVGSASGELDVLTCGDGRLVELTHDGVYAGNVVVSSVVLDGAGDVLGVDSCLPDRAGAAADSGSDVGDGGITPLMTVLYQCLCNVVDVTHGRRLSQSKLVACLAAHDCGIREDRLPGVVADPYVQGIYNKILEQHAARVGACV